MCLPDSNAPYFKFIHYPIWKHAHLLICNLWRENFVRAAFLSSFPSVQPFGSMSVGDRQRPNQPAKRTTKKKINTKTKHGNVQYTFTHYALLVRPMEMAYLIHSVLFDLACFFVLRFYDLYKCIVCSIQMPNHGIVELQIKPNEDLSCTRTHKQLLWNHVLLPLAGRCNSNVVYFCIKQWTLMHTLMHIATCTFRDFNFFLIFFGYFSFFFFLFDLQSNSCARARAHCFSIYYYFRLHSKFLFLCARSIYPLCPFSICAQLYCAFCPIE